MNPIANVLPPHGTHPALCYKVGQLLKAAADLQSAFLASSLLWKPAAM
jgi:hypothetical protein